VAVIISDAGVQRERAFYSPYGRVFGMPAGDLDFDGEFTSAEATTISGWSAAYRAYADINLDGVIDGDDATANTPGVLGWDALSRDGSTIGYAGYVQDSYFPTLSHVRNRVYKSDLGRWVQRDPAGYVDGASLYEYVRSSPVGMRDPIGLASLPGFRTGCGGSIGFDACGGGTFPSDPWQDGFDKAVRCVQRGATTWTDCMMCCGHGASGPHDPRLEGCRAGCDRHANPDPIYTPEPPFVPECWRVSPQPPGSLCLDYEPCETYSGANARCFCLCMGSDPWSDFVRACLRCHYDKGEDPDASHQDCYDEADRRYPGQRPLIKLAKCAATCWTYQARYCPRTTIPSVIRWWIWPFSDSGAVD
ncbi:MAG: hypothetical protein KIT54_10120, partial [Phycisphaeraceae bacterium]|nr:hypothetical protein [Phycisphaeraceae bacterium]